MKIQMTFLDNGINFDPEIAEQAGGQGLRNILERAEKIGATCLVQSSPEEEVIITVEVYS